MHIPKQIYSSYSGAVCFGNSTPQKPRQLSVFDGIIPMDTMGKKPFGVDEKVFSKQELQALNLSDISKTSVIWRGTSAQPHTLYRGMASLKKERKKSDEEEGLRAQFIEKVSALKKGETICLNGSGSHPFLTYTSYDPLEASVYADLEGICSEYVEKRMIFEIELPRNSHMFVNPTGYRSSVLLPVGNIYQLTDDPRTIKAKVKTMFDGIQNVEFVLVKVKLKDEKL